MKNYAGQSFLTFMFNKFKMKIESYHIDSKLNIVWNKFIWYCDLINQYFNKRGIVTICIICILASIIFSEYIKTIFTFGCVGIVLCLINKFINTIYTKSVIIRKIPDPIFELDNIISECIVEYLILNQYEGTKYLSSNDETKIKKEVANMISSRLSDTMIEKLSIKYNELSIYTIIASRINMIVMRYVIETNKNIDSSKINNNKITGTPISSTIPYIANANFLSNEKK